MALETMLAEVNAARAAYEAKRKEIDGAFGLALAAKVVEVNGGKGCSWEQYTAYFNDGEPCHFRVRAYDTPKAVRELLKTIPVQLMEDAFGDHVTVIVNDDGTYTLEANEGHD